MSLLEKVWDDRKSAGKTKLAESGGRRLMPFVSSLVRLTNEKANELLGFSKGEGKAIFNFQGFTEKDISLMVDGKEGTYANFQSSIQKAGDWYGLDLGSTKRVT